MPSRALFPLFSSANPLYAGAVVDFRAVDGSGALADTRIALYTELTGSDQLPNPQRLTSDGKLPQPTYFAANCRTVITKDGVASDDVSGIFQPGAAGGSVTAFTDLTDAPSSLSGQGNKILFVKSDGTAIEFRAVSTLSIPTSISDFGDVPGFTSTNKYQVLQVAAAGTELELVNQLGHPRPGYTAISNADADITNFVTTENVVDTDDLTADHTVTLSATNAVEGLAYNILRLGGGDFNRTVTGLVGSTTQAIRQNQGVRVAYLNGAWRIVDFLFLTLARDFRDQIISNAYLQSHHEVAPTITSASGALTLDFDLAQVQLVAPAEAITSIAFENLQTGYSTVMLIYKADGTNVIATTAWPTGTIWVNNLVPDLTQLTAGQRARIMLWHVNGELDNEDPQNPVVYGSFELLYPAVPAGS